MIAAAAADAAPYKHLLIDRSWHHLIRVAAVNFDRSRTISLLAQLKSRFRWKFSQGQV
jgi:hypothetical protein